MELTWNAEAEDMFTVHDLEAVINHEEEVVDEYFFEIDYSINNEEDFAA